MRIAVKCNTLEEFRAITKAYPHCNCPLDDSTFKCYSPIYISVKTGCFGSYGGYKDGGFKLIDADIVCHLKGIVIEETHTMILDGKEVIISEESYQEMKKLFK